MAMVPWMDVEMSLRDGVMSYKDVEMLSSCGDFEVSLDCALMNGSYWGWQYYYNAVVLAGLVAGWV